MFHCRQPNFKQQNLKPSSNQIYSLSSFVDSKVFALCPFFWRSLPSKHDGCAGQPDMDMCESEVPDREDPEEEKEHFEDDPVDVD